LARKLSSLFDIASDKLREAFGVRGYKALKLALHAHLRAGFKTNELNPDPEVETIRRAADINLPASGF
jgi:hypothetical protein